MAYFYSNIYGGDGVAAIYRQRKGVSDQLYYIHKDNLGSFDKVTDQSGTVVDSYSFDAWGNRRSTTDWTAAETTTATNNHLFTRGFTGHEHLDEFGLINMNGRCYDPLLGRILSPDPELQDPSNIQNYNRYSYCLNNPLKYTDPSGYKSEQYENLLTFYSTFIGWNNMNNDNWQQTTGYNMIIGDDALFSVGGDGGSDGNDGGSPGIDDKTWQDILGVLGLSSGYSNKPGSSAEDPADEINGNPQITGCYCDNKKELIQFMMDNSFITDGVEIGGLTLKDRSTGELVYWVEPWNNNDNRTTNWDPYHFDQKEYDIVEAYHTHPLNGHVDDLDAISATYLCHPEYVIRLDNVEKVLSGPCGGVPIKGLYGYIEDSYSIDYFINH